MVVDCDIEEVLQAAMTARAQQRANIFMTIQSERVSRDLIGRV
jgi:hypothetical protein